MRAEEDKLFEAFGRRLSLILVAVVATLSALAWISTVANMAEASSGGIAGFSGNPDTNGALVEYDGEGSSGSDGIVDGWEWDFSDQSTSALRKLSPAYSAADSFNITLTVSDDSALSGTDTATLTIGAQSNATTAPSVSEIYSSMCADCHGANGEGGDGPSLQASRMSVSELKWIIANGLRGMPYYSRSLSSSEISGLADFAKMLQIPGATTSSPPSGGADIYSSNCAGCHGDSGQGGAGPSLQTSTLSSSAISTIVADGSGGMPGFSSSLDAVQIADVASHTASLQNTDDTTPDAGTDAAAAYAIECAGCHGADGEGGFGPSLQALTMSANEIQTVIADGFGAMGGFSDALTPEQISQLAAFSVGLQSGAASGAEGSLLYSTHCAACHGVSGEGGIGPSLTGTSLSAGEIASVLQGGGSAMHGLASAIAPDEMATIAEYALTLTGDTDGSDDPTAPDAAAATYETMCAGCHGAAGEGASAPALAGTALDTAGLVSIIAEGRNGMPGYAGQLSGAEIEDLAGLIIAMGQGHGDVSDPDDAPTTTRAALTPSPDPAGTGDEDEGSAARTLGIILLSLVLGSATYLGFTSRAMRREE
jgi:mono/diheme cytochrome c family protein